jgi:hypothetical protein
MYLLRRIVPALALLGLLAGAAGSARADVVTVNFDDLSPGFVPSSYDGFNWGSNWGVDDTSDYESSYGNTYGAPSPPNFAYNAYGTMQVALSGGQNFDFLGAQVSTWAGNDQFAGYSSATVTATGYLNGVLVGSSTATLTPTGFTPWSANLMDVNSLVFSNDGVDGHWWLIDNMTFNVPSIASVPEPSMLIFGGIGAVAFIGFGRRRRKRAAA